MSLSIFFENRDVVSDLVGPLRAVTCWCGVSLGLVARFYKKKLERLDHWKVSFVQILFVVMWVDRLCFKWTLQLLRLLGKKFAVLSNIKVGGCGHNFGEKPVAVKHLVWGKRRPKVDRHGVNFKIAVTLHKQSLIAQRVSWL